MLIFVQKIILYCRSYGSSVVITLLSQSNAFKRVERYSSLLQGLRKIFKKCTLDTLNVYLSMPVGQEGNHVFPASFCGISGIF